MPTIVPAFKHKIKVQIKEKPLPIFQSEPEPVLGQEQLSDPDSLVQMIGIHGLLRLCHQHKVITRGGPKNICNTLKKKLYKTTFKETDPSHIVARAFVQYLFWKLGRCELKRCVNNDIDFYTSASISTIPVCYKFFTGDDTGALRQAHGYDIRSLLYFRDHGSSNFRNPYTDQPFSEDELKRLCSKTHWLKRLGYQISYPAKLESRRPGQYNAEMVNQYTVNVFSALNEHQYVDHEWFISLRFDALKSLYHELFEIWNYRLPMQSGHKARMVSGQILGNWVNVSNYQPSMEYKLRSELLKNIEKLVTEGETVDHRKNGCYIFMLGLVLVCEEAATSHPHMYHAAYYDNDEF
jgi:hypothetical protein